MQNKFIQSFLRANRRIWHHLNEGCSETLFSSHSRGYGGDISKQIDYDAENIFWEELSSFGAMFLEESGKRGEGDIVLTIDPLDGSDNAAHGIPYFGTSVAYQKENTTIAAIANLATSEAFIRTNLREIEKYDFNANQRPYTPLKGTTTGFFERAYAYPDMVQKLYEAGLKFRSPGAIALSLAYTPGAAFFLFLGKLRPFDVNAGWHLCEGLFRYRDENCMIIARDKTIFDTLYQLTH